MFSKKEKSIISSLFCAYLIIISFGLLIYYWLTKNPCIDKSAITNIFVWSATLFAPITALLLLNSWKYQYRINLINLTALEACKLIEKSEKELLLFEFLLPNLQQKQANLINNEIIIEINQLTNTIFEAYYSITRLRELVTISKNIDSHLMILIEKNYDLSKKIKAYIVNKDTIVPLNISKNDIKLLTDALHQVSGIVKGYIKEDIEIE